MILISKKIKRKKEIIFRLMIISGKNILKKIKKQKRLLQKNMKCTPKTGHNI